MANELRHADVGTALSKSEWEATGGHIFNSQAAGDIMYASSTWQLSRLGIGSAGQILQVNSGATAPEWTSSPTIVTAILPDSADGATIGSATAEWSDLYMADGAVIYLGADQDVTITHVADSGVLINSDNYITFRDSALKIHSSADGQLDIDADTEIEIAATTVDINGNADISGTLTIGSAGSGSDVTFYSATSGDHMLWDASDEKLVIIGTDGANALEVTDGNVSITDNLDVDGTLEADAYTVDGTALATYIRDTVGTNMLSSNTESGITVTYDTSNDNIDFSVDASQTAITSITNASLVVGYGTSHANIDFSTDNAIIMDIDGTQQIKLIDGVLQPITDADIDLGTASYQFKDAFFHGTVESDAYTVGGDTLAEYIADTVGAMVSSNTESGITVAYQDGDNTLDFTVGTLNQDTTGTATNATHVTVADNESTDENDLIPFIENASATGNVGLESDGDFHYNPSSGTVTATVFAGNISIGGTAVSATATELNYNDTGAAVGTVVASKTVTVDSNKDVASFRNITLTGELDAATLDLSSSADIAGDLVLSGGADGALQFTNAGENSIKIPDNQASALIIEEADNAYITFVTTNSSEAITVAKATTFSAGIADAGTIASGTWNGTAIDGGYINDNIISGQDEITSGLAAADELLYSDAGTVKRVGLDTLTSYLAGVNAGTVTSTGLSDSSGVISLDIQNMTVSTTIADADLIVVDDGANGTLRKMTRANFIESAALDSINIDGGAIDGVTLGTNSAVTQAVIDNININGTTIGHTDDTDLMTLADGVLSVAGTLDVTGSLEVATIDYQDGDLAITIADGGGVTFAQDVTIKDDKKIIFGDGSDASLEYDEDGTDELRITGNTIFEDDVTASKGIIVKPANSAADDGISTGTGVGLIATMRAVTGIGVGELVHIDANGDLDEAHADASADMPAIGIALTANTSGSDANIQVLLQGFYRDDTLLSFGTMGAPVYVDHSTEGDFTLTPSTTDGHFIQRVGISVTDDMIYFSPSLDVIERD